MEEQTAREALIHSVHVYGLIWSGFVKKLNYYFDLPQVMHQPLPPPIHCFGSDGAITASAARIRTDGENMTFVIVLENEEIHGEDKVIDLEVPYLDKAIKEDKDLREE